MAILGAMQKANQEDQKSLKKKSRIEMINKRRNEGGIF